MEKLRWSTRVPGRIFTPQERKRLDAFPSEIAEADLIDIFPCRVPTWIW